MSMDVEQLYRRYYPLLQAKCTRMLRDGGAAEEVAQETFARLWRSRADLEQPAAVTAWLYKTATRLAIDHLRKRERRQLVSDVSREEAASSSSVNEVRRAEARELLAEIASQVPARELEVALLSRVDGLTQVEIGEVTQRSGRTVRRLLTSFDERMKTWTREQS